jgi:hypothetical protein
MTLAEIGRRLTALFEGGGLDRRPPRWPETAVLLAPDRVTAVRFQQDRRSRRLVLRACDSQPLPAGAIEPALARPNILAAEPVVAALRAVLARVAPGEHRVAAVLPDEVARVSILPFATLPRTRRELLDLVRFRMAKSLPFKADDAVVDLMVIGSRGGGPAPAAASVFALFAQRAVIEQYEALFRACGCWPGLLSVATLEIHNLFRSRLGNPADPDKDTALLALTPAFTSILIFRAGDLLFYRCKPHLETGVEEGLLETRREIYTSLAFYQEKLLGRGLGRVVVHAAGLPLEAVREAVAGEVGCPAEILDPAPLYTCGDGVSLPDAEAALAAPAIGAVIGRRA